MRVRFVIKLAGLREIDLLVFEIIHFEERGGAFAGGGREDGRIDQREAVRIEIIANAFDYFVADAEDGVLAFAAQPQMAMVHQKIDAVVLGRDRVGVRFGDALEDFGAFDVHLVTAGRARLGADFSANDQRRFLGEVLQRFKERFVKLALHRDALHDARAVAQQRESDLPGLAEIIEPAGDLNRFAGVLADAGDGDARRRCGSVFGHQRLSSFSKISLAASIGWATSGTSLSSSSSGY